MGPPGLRDKTVIYLAADFRNGGVMGVYRAFEEAAHLLGWKVFALDGSGSSDTLAQAFSKALGQHPDAMVLGGFDPSALRRELRQAAQQRVVLVGWHAAQAPGPSPDLFCNVSTDPTDVGRLAADFVLRDAERHQRKVGVLILNDDQFSVANTKTRAMKARIEACAPGLSCQVLAVENLKISEAEHTIPTRVAQWARHYGADWTYTLAINDIYFDNINYPLRDAGRADVVNVSAGDGSARALSRIHSGLSQQSATVAEPLGLQGYQLVDEINRALHALGPSGYVSQPVLVSSDGLDPPKGQDDSALETLRQRYRASWLGSP